MGLLALLKDLVRQGCFPCISFRGGGVWRAHVNGAGNFWEDANTPYEALAKATKAWEEVGQPMDGYAVGDH